MKQNLDERQNRVLEIWLNNPNDTYTEIARKAGIGFTTFWRYRSNEDFMTEYHKRCQQRFKELENKAIAQLENKLDGGEWRAIQYTLDGLGYKAPDKVEANVTNQDFVIRVE